MKMHSVKTPKKTKAQLKKECEPCCGTQEEYPWGLRITMDNDTLGQVPEAKKLKVGDEVEIKAVGKVISKEVDTRDGQKTRRRTEIQIIKMGVAGKSNAEKDFDEELDA